MRDSALSAPVPLGVAAVARRRGRGRFCGRGGLSRCRARGCSGLCPRLFGSFAEVFGDLGHGLTALIKSGLLAYSGPEMPPSLRTLQKWTAMKMTVMNGNISTWSTYQRSSVSGPISTPPKSTNRI